MNPFATYRRIQRILNPLGTVTPPAAEGGRPGGEAAAPVAPRRDMPDDGPVIDASTEWRWRRALLRICRDGCSHGDAAFACPDLPLARTEWCPSCIAYAALYPPTPSPQPDPLRSEAARPGPPHGDFGGSGRATNVP